ncbi:hypothetical protein O4H52_19470 [Sphingomonadaceae bacterium G21617-S1]|nr:hypothetical protein [Sphingomonadaceae bacterium G21617-S1]
MRVVGRIDLTSLARTLRDSGRHPALVKAIDRAAAAGSIREDLRTALDSLRQIVAIQDRAPADHANRPLHDETVATGALFTQAVVLYARATETQGDRPKLLGEGKLDSAQRATHDEAMDMRNKVVAHFGRGDAMTDGPLVKEAVVLSLYLDGERRKKRVGAYTTRAAHKAAFAARLAALLETRLGEVADRYQKLFDAVDAALETAATNDTELGQSLPSFGFDPDLFCASQDAARHLRAQLDDDVGSDLDYAVKVPKP